jgi:hypothetical protein
MAGAAGNRREVQVTIRRKGGTEETYTASSKGNRITLYDEAEAAKYRALLNEAKQLIPDKSKKSTRKNKLQRVQICRLAMGEQISLQAALGRLQANCRSTTRPNGQPSENIKRNEKPTLLKTPQWAKRLMQPSKLPINELSVALQRVRSLVDGHHREGRSFLLGERILEKLSKEMVHRECKSSGYAHILQGGLPGLGKHKS